VRVAIAKQEQIPVPAGRRAVKLELVGHDRLGIVSELSGSLARRRVSIEDLHTEIAHGATPAEQLFKVKALLLVPETVPNDELRRALEPLMKEMTVDIALGESPIGA
jgi:glycine cleavage system regulatory protein